MFAQGRGEEPSVTRSAEATAFSTVFSSDTDSVVRVGTVAVERVRSTFGVDPKRSMAPVVQPAKAHAITTRIAVWTERNEVPGVRLIVLCVTATLRPITERF